MKSPLSSTSWKCSLIIWLLLACQKEIHWDNENKTSFGNYMVATFAGIDSAGRMNGDTSIATFNSPAYIALDTAGSLLVTDRSYHRIRKISPDGLVSTIAGRDQGFVDGDQSDARFNRPCDMAVDSRGNIFIVDKENHCIRMLSTNGKVSTIAGNGKPGSANGVGSAAQFNLPSGIALDGEGNLFVADEGNHLIRKITQGVVSTIAGKNKGFADGEGLKARFNDPIDIAADKKGNIYVADRDNHRIRKITPDGMVSTLAGRDSAGYVDGAGSVAMFNFPKGVATDDQGNVYVSDSENNRIRKITPDGQVSTIAGSGIAGFANGPGTEAQFSEPRGLIVDKEGKYLYVADLENHRIRKITLR